MKLLNLRIGVVASCQKLGIILGNKEIQKLMLLKNGLLISYSSMKKNRKASDDFWRIKLTLKVKFRHFFNNRNKLIANPIDPSPSTLKNNGPSIMKIFLHYCIGRVLILLEFFNFFFRIHILKLKKYSGVLLCSLGPGKKQCFLYFGQNW